MYAVIPGPWFLGNDMSDGVRELWGLMKMFGPKWEEVAGGWRKLHNEELHGCYITLNIIRLMKSKKMRRERHVARIGKKKSGYRIGKPEGKRPNTVEGVGVDGSLVKNEF
jgi:hypothetical protein